MRKQDVSILLAEIRKLNYKPNNWEHSFLNGISQRVELTEAQSKKLQDIYAKASGGGIYIKREV